MNEYVLMTEEEVLLHYVDSDDINKLLIQYPDSVRVCSNGEILMLKTVTIRYKSENKSSAFLYKGFKLKRREETTLREKNYD